MSKSTAIEIRPIQPGQEAAARALILAGLQAYWGTLDPTANPDLDDICSSYKDAVFLLAWKNQVLIGTGGLIPEQPAVGRIVRMSVDPSARRQGIGSLILNALLDAARTLGYQQLVLETTSSWQGAIKFYLHHGFEISHHANGDTHFIRKLTE